MTGLSGLRILAVLIKEFKQLTRDRITYAMMLAIPVVQLTLFGYAINTEPRHLPTAVLMQEDSRYARSITAALRTRSTSISWPRPAAPPSWTGCCATATPSSR